MDAEQIKAKLVAIEKVFSIWEARAERDANESKEHEPTSKYYKGEARGYYQARDVIRKLLDNIDG
jgi:hypothetical protein